MKKLTKLGLLCAFALTCTITSMAQTTYKEARAQLKDKAVKDARKEARKWKKKGFNNLPGDMLLDKQFEESMVLQYMKDEEGRPLYISAFGTAVAGSEGVASANALDNARIGLAGQVQAEVSALISNNKANSQYSTSDVETIDEFISNSKTLIQKELGSIKPVIRMYRESGGNVEYRYTIMYDLKEARRVTKKLIKKGLQEKLKENEEDLDKLLGL